MIEKLTSLETADCCLSGIFRLGENTVKEIRSTKDGKISFIDIGDKTLCSIESASGQSAVYPLNAVDFQPPAEYIVMDLDGTSIISEEFWIGIVQKTTSALVGREIVFTECDIPYVSGYTTAEHLDYALRKYGDANKRYENIAETYYAISHEELASALANGAEQIRPVAGLKEFLLEVKRRGVKIGLVSSGLFYKAIPEIETAFRAMDLGNPLDFYDEIIMGGVAKNAKQYATIGEIAAKPHPWLYKELVSEGFHCRDNKKVVVLEDSASGALSARLAGFPVIGMANGNIASSDMGELCFAHAENFQDVLQILFKGENL